MHGLIDLTAVIASKGRTKNLAHCVASALSCNPMPKIIVVDFGNATPLSTVLPDVPQLRIIRVNRDTELFNKPRALNIGIKSVDTKYLCITDADQVFGSNFFGVVYAELENIPRCIVFSKTYFLPEAPKLLTPEKVRGMYKRLLALAKNGGGKPRGYGCCHGSLTSWFLKVHGYDEAYVGWGAEDRDLEVRAGFDGLKARWVHTKATMVHLPHPKRGAYYNNEYFEKNMKLYEYRRDLTDKSKKIDNIVVNKNRPWGEL